MVWVAQCNKTSVTYGAIINNKHKFFYQHFVGAILNRPQYRIILVTAKTLKKWKRWQRAIKNRPYKMLIEKFMFIIYNSPVSH
jgi:hypothetical protein